MAICPTGYYQNSTSNQCAALASQDVFYINFFEFLEYNATSIGNFSHPQNLPFIDQGKASPIPTRERGFYFANTSTLNSTVPWVFSPTFYFRINFNIQSDGVMFTIFINNTAFMVFESISWNPTLKILLVNTSSPTLEAQVWNLPGISSCYGWKSIGVYSTQQKTSIFINNNQWTMYPSGFEFRTDSYALFVLGGSFKGFFTQMYFTNSAGNTYLSAQGADCGANTYIIGIYHYGTCSSQAWPWCIRANSNNTCYSTNCASCTGYGYSDCLLCSNNSVAPDCTIGLHCSSGTGTFNCSICLSGYVLIDGLCELNPYNYNQSTLTTPIFNLVFNTIQQFYGNYFQNGLNSQTYAPYNNPEADDPWPTVNRGFYFNGNSYLTTTAPIALNYKFSVAVWTYSINYGFIFQIANVTFGGYGWYNVIISNFESSILIAPHYSCVGC